MNRDVLGEVLSTFESRFGRARLAEEGYHWRIPVPDAHNRSVDVCARPVPRCGWVDVDIVYGREPARAPAISVTVRDVDSLAEVMVLIDGCIIEGAGSSE